MTLPIIAGGLCLLAFGVHTFVGTREFQHFRPGADAAEKPKEAWVQSLAGWQVVSVELLSVSILLLLIGTTSMVPNPGWVLGAIAIYFASAGTTWLATVLAWGHNRPRLIWTLGQWLFFYLIAILSGLSSLWHAN
ncbi:MAG: hypothetical protein AB8B50_02025 [Pirellulaceae bacterium]